MKKILITRKLPPIAKELLSKHFSVLENEQNRFLSKDELIRAAGEYDGMLTTIPDRLDREVLEKATRLSAISNYAIGLDNIDVEAAQKKGIRVYNLPDIVTNSTADLTFALLLALARHVCEARSYVREGRWDGVDLNLFVGEELCGKTLGIVGFGRIGQAVARRALGFGLKVIAYHRSQMKPELPVEQVSWDDLLARSDYVSIHVPLTPETKGMIGRDQIAKMKRKPMLINMARGPIVATDALVEALKSGALRGAALDVTDPEPLAGGHPLCKLGNCLIVPHIGTSTLECREAMAKKAAQQLIEHFV